MKRLMVPPCPRVPPLEDDQNFLAGFPHPALYLEQFDLQLALFRFIEAALEFFLVGVVRGVCFSHAGVLLPLSLL